MSNFDINKLRNVILEFKVPIAFDVPNSMKREDDGKPYIVVLNNVPAKIHFERIYDFRYKDEFNIAPFSKMPEDRSGILSHTKLQVWFDRQMFDSPRINKDVIRIMTDQFVDIAIEYVNKFIKMYKEVTNEFWIRPIIRKDIFSHKYLLRDTDGNHELLTTLISHPHIVHFSGGEEFKLTQGQDNDLRKLLVSNFYNLRNELIMLMLDNFSLGYYNIALLQSVTIFENYVYSHLKQTLSKTKLDAIKKKKDCGCFVGISEVCSRGFKEHFGVDFGDTDEFTNLNENALKYRNLIVHGELLENINKDVCERGINSVKIAENYLFENIFNKIQIQT